MRFVAMSVLALLVVGNVLGVVLGMRVSSSYYWLIFCCGPLLLLAIWDMIQTRHSICRNFPVLGRLRFLQEAIRPEWHQYFIESNTDGRPFNRDERSLVYQRAKGVGGIKPYGTELDVYQEEFEWLNHSIAPHPRCDDHFRINVGGPACKRPYSCSLLNISAMSFGAISPNAILAMNRGARKGDFYHTTGEGGLSPYHRENGGDLVWQIGTGYFGCRTDDGRFNADLFREQAVLDQVRMIEIKISQGAKPGHGGVLPASKITREIADTRKVPMGRDCISPPGHSEFHTPIELCEFIQRLRDMAEGKPIGFKLCIGQPREFLSICKAMLKTDIYPDFITVDGAEGGTGAAPMEFSDHLGCPLREGILFVHNALVGCGLRSHIRIACSGKVTSAFDIARNLALGADWCNSARAFMMAVGCIQAQSCHTNRCPVGVATQNRVLQRALHVGDKSERVYRFHRNTMATLADIVAAAGLDHPEQLEARHICRRVAPNQVKTYAEAFEFLDTGRLLSEFEHPFFRDHWDAATAESFTP